MYKIYCIYTLEAFRFLRHEAHSEEKTVAKNGEDFQYSSSYFQEVSVEAQRIHRLSLSDSYALESLDFIKPDREEENNVYYITLGERKRKKRSLF